MKSSIRLISGIAAVICLYASGCANSVSVADPEVLFDHALDRFTADHSVVKWEGGGSMIVKQLDDLQWNPLADIEQFRNNAEEITIDEAQSNLQFFALSIVMSPEAVKKTMIAQARQRMDDIHNKVTMQSKAQSNQLSKAVNKQMNTEIEQHLQQADKQLVQLLEHANIHSDVVLWVKRTTSKPARLNVNTTIEYDKDGRKSQEQTVDHFVISG